MKTKPALALFLACLMLHTQFAFACVNTTYSRDEEKQLTGETIKLITGQFAQHSAAFYTNEVATLEAALAKNPGYAEAQNDLAVAHLKLGQFDTALTMLEGIDQEHPGRYKTHANLGVLLKKMGDFPEAAKHIEKSLEIKPEGHLGLGDYYLKMLHWREAAAQLPKGEAPLTNFLGTAYEAGPEATVADPDFNREYIETLIKADRHFADAMFVLGDALFVEGDYELAMRAYLRTQTDLNHSAHDILNNRIDKIHKKWIAQAETKKEYVLMDYYSIWTQASQEVQQAEEWVQNFQTVEASLINPGTRTDIATVKQAMQERRIAEPVYLEIGVFKGSEYIPGLSNILMTLGILAGIGLLVVIAICRAVKKWRARNTTPIAAS